MAVSGHVYVSREGTVDHSVQACLHYALLQFPTDSIISPCAFTALSVLVWRQEGHPACKK